MVSCFAQSLVEKADALRKALDARDAVGVVDAIRALSFAWEDSFGYAEGPEAARIGFERLWSDSPKSCLAGDADFCVLVRRKVGK